MKFRQGVESQVLWQAEMTLPYRALAAFEEELAPLGLACATFGEGEKHDWTLQLLFDAPPDSRTFQSAMARAAAKAAIPPPQARIAPLAPANWVEIGNRLLAPQRIDRFYFYGAHDAAPVPAGSWGLRIEAGMAFGTGRAPSTQGCLKAIAAAGRRRRGLGRVLDIGAGSGILGLAAARAGARNVVALDIDPVAVAVARANVAANGLRARVRVEKARPGRLLAPGRFDLIVANILAPVVARLAPRIAPRLKPGGAVVLAGLIAGEEPGVLAAYRRFGLSLRRRTMLGNWPALTLARRR
jgi:ribosomal protein L11 methyltransferase